MFSYCSQFIDHILILILFTNIFHPQLYAKSMVYIAMVVSAVVLNYILSTIVHKSLVYTLYLVLAVVLNCILSIKGDLKVDLNFKFSFPFCSNFNCCLNIEISIVYGMLIELPCTK